MQKKIAMVAMIIALASGCTGEGASSSSAPSSTSNSVFNTSSRVSSSSSSVSSVPVSSLSSAVSLSSSSSAIGQANSDLVGFATVPAYGVQTTTGGAAGRTVIAATYEDLVAYAGSDEALTIEIRGTLSGPVTGYEKVRVASNKTIIGVGTDATFSEIGLRVGGLVGCSDAYNEANNYVSNVIIRNIKFTNIYDTKSNPDADGVTIECFSHHVWVDHNTFIYKPVAGVSAGSFDGALDSKRGADYITLSWNHFYHYDKVSLVGHVDTNSLQDAGRLHVTFHHNYYENTQQRHPLLRFGKVHTFNNYVFNNKARGSQIGYFASVRAGAEIYIEGNYFDIDSGEFAFVNEDSGSDIKVTIVPDNIIDLVNPNADTVIHVNNGNAFNPSDFYDYSHVLDSAESLPVLVPAMAGAGKL
ncbi:MAG: hypothetical protein U5M23_12675 [Marinagarivorans sp.]|nr:hypothetical protein [Marinagarivorans sp.]